MLFRLLIPVDELSSIHLAFLPNILKSLCLEDQRAIVRANCGAHAEVADLVGGGGRREGLFG